MRSTAFLIALVGVVRVASADSPALFVSTNVLDLPRQTFVLALDFRLTEHVTLRGELGYDARKYYDTDMLWDYKGGAKGAFGVRGFLRAPYEGAFADLDLEVRTFATTDICNTNNGADPYGGTCRDEWSALSPRLRVGWQHTLASGLSFAAAVGIAYEWVARDLISYTDVLFVSEIRVGYAF